MRSAATRALAPALTFAPTAAARAATYGMAYGPDPDPKMSCPVGIEQADALRLMDAYNAAKHKAPAQ